MDKPIAILTGASSDIGRDIAMLLAKRYTIILVGRNKSQLDRTLFSIKSTSPDSYSSIVDLSNIDNVKDFVSKVRKQHSHIDLIINCAAIWHSSTEAYFNKPYEDYSEKLLLDTMNVGLMSPMLLIHGLLSIMDENSHIINISGTFENGAKGWLPYFTSKQSLEVFTKGLSEELKDKKIRVNCISPSDTATEPYKQFFPQYISESIEPSEVAIAVERILSSSETGSIIVIKKDQ